MIVKLKSRKQKCKILNDRKILRNNSENLNQLKLAGNELFIPESMCHENHQLAYKCRQLKNSVKIHSRWFWNNITNVKLNKRSQHAKIYQIIDIEELLGLDKLGEFINNTSLQLFDFLILLCLSQGFYLTHSF